jgi:hypothetical protein
MTRPTGEPTLEELKAFQNAVYAQQSKMMSEWLQQEQHETQFGNYPAFGESRTSAADGIRGRMEAIQQRMLQETSAIQKAVTDGLISTDCAHQKVAQMQHHMQMWQQQLTIQMSPYAAPQHELGREPPVGVGGTSIDKTKAFKGQRNGAFVLSAICVAVAPCPFRRPDLSDRYSDKTASAKADSVRM